SLVNPEIIGYAKKECEVHNSAYMSLEDVIEVMEEAEGKGLMTVRLHTGDPSLYGAIREQMDLLKEKNIKYDICPGVSSFSGAAASLGIEYTLPNVSQSVIITRAEGRPPVPEKERLYKMAEHNATMVLFLSSGMAEKVKKNLIKGGYELSTPVAVVYKATWDDEKIINSTIENFCEDMKKENINKTALIIVGNVLGQKYERSKLYDPHFTTGYRKGI
ncbi:MAG: precorrin-4 C(11)-methyltransferase, partial [Clostridia bacterium]|nr:precorrin-4 C(11)-methyltransferase [Clostridia bacterium]